jgi:large subunit ribosomal protein L23
VKSPWVVIRKPVVTEKSMAGQARQVYTFLVAIDATKPEVHQAVEKAFNVKVDSVRTVRVKGKLKRSRNQVHTGRRKDLKKAFVTLKEGQRLDII